MQSKTRIFIFIWLCANCYQIYAQQWHTTIEILHPAKQNKLLGIENLLVVNNAVEQPMDFGHTDVVGNATSKTISIDLSDADRYFLFSVANTLEYAEEFGSVGLLDETQNTSGSFYSRKLLTKQQVQNLCTKYSADALLVLNSLVEYDKQGCYVGDNLHYYAYLEAYLSSNWTVQFPNGQQTAVSFNDTLYWETEEVSEDKALHQLPPRKQALLDMCEYSAERFANQFLPQWETVDRYLYENNYPLLTDALNEFTHKRWQQALEKWQETYRQTADNKKQYLTSAYAAANMAVVSEIMGNLVLARQWAQKAADQFSKVKGADALQQRINLIYYRGQLNQRIIEQQKMNVK